MVIRTCMLVWAILFINIVTGNQATSADHGDLQVTMDTTGRYTVHVQGSLWLRSADTFFTSSHRVYTTADGSLVLTGIDHGMGYDKLGPWNMTQIYYQLSGSDVKVKVMIKWYRDLPLVLFGQHYMSDISGCSHGNHNAVSSSFPSYYVENATARGGATELGYLAYGGIMTGNTNKHVSIWNSTMKVASGLDSGPLVLFDRSNHSIIISPFNNAMATSVQYIRSHDTGRTAHWGILGDVDEVPAGYESWVSLMYSSRGVNKLLHAWGDVMRYYYNKERSYTHDDLANNYLGYYTDNGGYYYYVTEPGMNYQDTILAVKNYSLKHNIPYRYVQYDSWWYPKDLYKGVTEWTSMMSVFPRGLRYMWEKTGWPVVAHNRWWSSKAIYAKQNGGKYDFIVENKTSMSIPTDQRFWDDLMTQSKQWGLITYEQDWLNVEFDNMLSTVSSLTLGRLWLHEMGRAAQRAGISVQYCMSPVRHILTSLEIPAVTQVRVTMDYQPGSDINWRIGTSSMLADAVGLAPFKDTFWTTNFQPGNPYNMSEPYPALNAVVATLSTASVAPSDRVGYSNISLIMRSCRSDGLLLKPSIPIMVTNKQLMLEAYSGFTGELWSTYSSISGLQFGLILGAAFSHTDAISLTPTEAGLHHQYYPLKIYQGDQPDTLTDYTLTQPVKLSHCTRGEFCIYYTTPVLNMGSQEVVILGEMSKWVHMSPQRVSSISITNTDLYMTLTGGQDELVNLTFYVDGARVDVACKMDSSGSATLLLSQRSCHGL